MATRINTKFILILTAIVFAAVGIVGGLWVLQLRGDTSRHIRGGDALMAEGEYERALKEYGRAVSKEPAELSHLAKVEQALLSIRPASQDLANEYDSMRISILRHRVRYRPTDPDAHMALVTELYRIARWFDQLDAWRELTEAAEEMWQRIPSSEPQRVYARLYRGLGRMRTMGYGRMGRVSARTATEAEIREACQDLEQFTEAVPDHDLGWATLVEAHLSIARQLEAEKQRRRAEQEYALVEELLQKAKQAAPDGPEVARVVALNLALEFVEGTRDEVDPELDAAINHMVDLVAPSDDPNLVADAGAILRSVDQTEGLARAIRLLQGYVDANPDKLYQRFVLAGLHYLNQDYDLSYDAARTIIDAEPVPVSVLARIQQMLRIRAAGLIVDIEFRRWELAEEADRDDQLELVQAARDALAALVADPENEPLLVEADGKIAIAKKDFAAAAAHFERALKLTPVEQFETLWYAARALEQIGQTGLARERLLMANTLRPGNAVVLSEKGRLEYKMGLLDEAQASIGQALEIDPDNQLSRRLVTAIDANLAQAQRAATDPVAKALVDAQATAKEGNLDEARSMLVSALESAEDPLPILTELVEVEVRAGQTEAAREYLQQAIAIQSSNAFLRRLEASLSNNNQIEALKQYMAGIYPDQTDRTVHTLINLRGMSREMKRMSEAYERRGDAELAEETRSRAEVAGAEADQYLATARQIAPGHPALLDHLFNEALAAQDWNAMEQLVAQARDIDADQAGGLIFRGRYEMARERYAQAIQTLTQATERKHYSSMAWRLLGRAHERQGNFADALRAYEQSYTCNPNDQYAVRWYVNLLLQTGQRQRGLRVLRTARHAVPNDAVLQEVRLELEAEVGDLLQAMMERRELYRRDPDNRVNALRLAALLGRSQPTYEHVVNDAGDVRYSSEQWNVLSGQDRQERLDETRATWQRESERILADLQERGEDSVELAALRADLQKIKGELRQGEQSLRDYVAEHPEEVRAYLALGQYQAGNGQIDAAIATYQAAKPYQGAERAADRALADVYFTNDMWRPALDLYRAMVTEGTDRNVTLRLIECYTKMQQYDAADTVLKELVANGGHDFFTSMLAASIAQGQAERLRADGDDAAAQTKEAEISLALDRAERLMPSNPLPHVRRAQGLVAEYNRTGRMTLLDDALMILDRADQVAAGAEATSRVRVAILRAKNDNRAAIGELTRLLQRTPGNTSARRLLVQLLVEGGNLNSAMDVVEEAIKLNPSAALWYEAKGDLNVLQRQPEAAAPAFRKAYELQPTGIRLSKYAELALAESEPNYEEITDLISSAVGAREGSPLLRGLYARALSGQGRSEEALQEMRVAYAEHQELLAQQPRARDGMINWMRTLQGVIAGDDPREYERVVRELSGDEPDAVELIWIARTWVNNRPTDGVSRAIELLEDARARCPAEDSMLRAQIGLDQGQFYVLLGDDRKAVDTFEEVLAIDPDHPLALNNAAYLYAQNLDEPDKAIPHAERANSVKPNDPFILDTLGWARFKLGDYEAAEEALRQSIDLSASADNHFHLAQVFAATNRYDKAMVYLRRAGELRPSAELQGEIDQLTNEVLRKMRR